MPETIGEHVRERRVLLGMTQPEAAAEVGVCRVTLANWEIGRAVPAVRVMPAVIAFLDYDPLSTTRSFSDLLRRARINRGLNQRDFADALSVPFHTLKNWERGAYGPSPLRQALVEERIAALA